MPIVIDNNPAGLGVLAAEGAGRAVASANDARTGLSIEQDRLGQAIADEQARRELASRVQIDSSLSLLQADADRRANGEIRREIDRLEFDDRRDQRDAERESKLAESRKRTDDARTRREAATRSGNAEILRNIGAARDFDKDERELGLKESEQARKELETSAGISEAERRLGLDAAKAEATIRQADERNAQGAASLGAKITEQQQKASKDARELEEEEKTRAAHTQANLATLRARNANGTLAPATTDALKHLAGVLNPSEFNREAERLAKNTDPEDQAIRAIQLGASVNRRARIESATESVEKLNDALEAIQQAGDGLKAERLDDDVKNTLLNIGIDIDGGAFEFLSDSKETAKKTIQQNIRRAQNDIDIANYEGLLERKRGESARITEARNPSERYQQIESLAYKRFVRDNGEQPTQDELGDAVIDEIERLGFDSSETNTEEFLSLFDQ